MHGGSPTDRMKALCMRAAVGSPAVARSRGSTALFRSVATAGRCSVRSVRSPSVSVPLIDS
eukprot:14812404-Alexandrium_andersonii.AAC.1